MSDYSFPKSHRLKRRRLIRPLFDRSRTDVNTLARGCVRLLWRMAAPEEVGADVVSGDVPLQIGFAPGRTRTAVRRNRIRRLLRETYRTQCQHALHAALSEHTEVLTVMVLYRSDPEIADTAIPRDLPEALQKLPERLET